MNHNFITKLNDNEPIKDASSTAGPKFRSCRHLVAREKYIKSDHTKPLGSCHAKGNHASLLSKFFKLHDIRNHVRIKILKRNLNRNYFQKPRHTNVVTYLPLGSCARTLDQRRRWFFGSVQLWERKIENSSQKWKNGVMRALNRT